MRLWFRCVAFSWFGGSSSLKSRLDSLSALVRNSDSSMMVFHTAGLVYLKNKKIGDQTGIFGVVCKIEERGERL